MRFERGQTQVLYQFLPGAVFEHDDYGFCRVTEVELDRTDRVNEGALFDAVGDLLYQWREEELRAGFPDPRNPRNRHYYAPGAPSTVRFAPYPTLLECRSCGRVFRLSELRRSREAVEPGRCPRCAGVLAQLRYAQAHNCGRVEELYRLTCPHHGAAYVTFYDTGRVATARWRCGACGGAEIGRLRMTPCNCAYSSLVAQTSHERGLKTMPVTDPALYLTHVVPFVNFNEEQERRLQGEPHAASLVLARTWGLLDQRVSDVAERRRILRRSGAESQELDRDAEEMARALEKVDPDHPAVVKWRESRELSATPPGEEAIRDVASLLGGATPREDDPSPRQLVEHTAMRDSLATVDCATAAGWMRDRGDEAGAQNLEEAQRLASEELGIAELMAVDDFPIALCAAGYTRITRDPTRSVLTPFEGGDTQGRTPLYVVAAETEGIYLRLDPVRVSSWLVENGLVQGTAPTSEAEAWAWLYANVPGTLQHRWQPDHDAIAAVAIRTLLHTISHVLLKHVEWSGFSQNSVGEYLIPGALSCMLYANRYAESKIGGLTSLFEQRLGVWLADSARAGRECVYDPFCGDEGGSCAGCLHREYNCPGFNRELSRAALFGGPTPQNASGGLGEMRRGFWQ